MCCWQKMAPSGEKLEVVVRVGHFESENLLSCLVKMVSNVATKQIRKPLRFHKKADSFVENDQLKSVKSSNRLFLYSSYYFMTLLCVCPHVPMCIVYFTQQCSIVLHCIDHCALLMCCLSIDMPFGDMSSACTIILHSTASVKISYQD